MSAPKDRTFGVAVKCVAGSALAMAAVAVAAYGPWAGVGVVAGGALATANLIFFGRLVEAFLGQKGNAAPWALLGTLKLLGLFGAAYIMLKTGPFSALSFAVGYAALPLGITISTLFARPPEDDEPSPAAPDASRGATGASKGAPDGAPDGGDPAGDGGGDDSEPRNPARRTPLDEG